MRALLSYVGWPVSFTFFGGGHGVPVERGCPFLPSCRLVALVV